MIMMNYKTINQARDLINKGFIKVTLKNSCAVVYYGINKDGNVFSRGYCLNDLSLIPTFSMSYKSLKEAASSIEKWQKSLEIAF